MNDTSHHLPTVLWPLNSLQGRIGPELKERWFSCCVLREVLEERLELQLPGGMMPLGREVGNVGLNG